MTKSLTKSAASSPSSSGGVRGRGRHQISRADRRRFKKMKLDSGSVIRLLDQFMEAIAGGKESPLDEDKELVALWGPARGNASALKKKDIPVDSIDQFNAIIKMKNRYGFEGSVHVDSSRLSDTDLVDMEALAIQEALNVVFY